MKQAFFAGNKHKVILSASDYYLSIARRVAIMKFICIFALIIYVFVSFTRNADYLNEENFKQLFRFFATDNEQKVIDSTGINFSYDKNNSFALVRGDIGVINDNGMSVFSADGSINATHEFKFDSPVTLETEKTLIIYDLCGKNLKVFGSFSELESKQYAYPILGVAANSTGGMAVLTSSLGYRSGFIVYDSLYREIYKKRFADIYAVFIDIPEDGSKAAVAAIDTENGEYRALMHIYDLSAEAPEVSYSYAEELALKISYFENGGICFLTDKCLRFYDSNYNLVNEIFFSKNQPEGCLFGEKYAILNFKDIGLDEKTALEIYGVDGEMTVRSVLPPDEKGYSLFKDRFYYISENKLHSVNVLDNTSVEYQIKDDSIDFRIFDGYALIFSYGSVYSINL